MPKQLRSCTVRELIEVLEGEEPDATVVFVSDYGDIGHTQQVHVIEASCEASCIEESAYSQSGWAIAQHDDEDDTDADRQQVLVLS